MMTLRPRILPRIGWKAAALSVAFAMLLAISIAVRQPSVARADGPAVPVTSQTTLGGWNNGWNWWGGSNWGHNNWWGSNWWNNYYNAWNSWPNYNSYNYSPYAYNYWPYSYPAYYSTLVATPNAWYNYPNTYWTGVTASSVNVQPGTPSPAWIRCTSANGSPTWVDAHNIPAGTFC